MGRSSSNYITVTDPSGVKLQVTSAEYTKLRQRAASDKPWNSYYCRKCKRRHRVMSKIGKNHKLKK